MVSTAVLLIVLAVLLPLPPLPEAELDDHDRGLQADADRADADELQDCG